MIRRRRDLEERMSSGFNIRGAEAPSYNNEWEEAESDEGAGAEKEPEATANRGGGRGRGGGFLIQHPHFNSDKAKVAGSETTEVREDGDKVAGVHAKPGGEGGEILVAGGGGDPAASADVVGAADGEVWEITIRFVA